MELGDLFASTGVSDAPSVVGQLKLWDQVVGLQVNTGAVEQEFLRMPQLPGFIVHSNEVFFGVLSRKTLLTAISQPFGREVFIKRPLSELGPKMDTTPLILAGTTPLAEALKLSMSRTDELRFDPVLINTGESIGLLEMHILMIAQANLLEEALASKAKLIAKIRSIFGEKA